VNDLLPTQSTPGGTISTKLYNGIQSSWVQRCAYNHVAVPIPALEAIETQPEEGQADGLDLLPVSVEIRTDPPELMKYIKISRSGMEHPSPSKLKPGFYKLTLPVEGTIRTLPDMEVTPDGKNIITIKVDPLTGEASIDRRIEP
jgi:hypothetical protein